jgi:glyoxalase family protein
MRHRILGLHHVTATVDAAQPDLDFCVELLGLRLLKKTVNFDNHHVFHFYYGTEQGAPGTIWTTFPYHGHGVRRGEEGAGQITATSFSVPGSALDFWKDRFASRGVAYTEPEPRFGERSIVVADPSSLEIELVASDRDAREPWRAGPVASNVAIRGLHSVSLRIPRPATTVALLADLFGFETVEETSDRIRLSIGSDAPGRALEIVHGGDPPPAVNGIGTVHHVAIAIGSADEQRHAREDLLSRGLKVTPVLDRQYFQSIYFREPGGVLFEIATISPGFAVDEPLESLGAALKLPPWEEANRLEIEAGLPKIKTGVRN